MESLESRKRRVATDTANEVFKKMKTEFLPDHYDKDDVLVFLVPEVEYSKCSECFFV